IGVALEMGFELGHAAVHVTHEHARTEEEAVPQRGQEEESEGDHEPGHAPDVPADCSTGPIAVNGWIPASSSVARRRRMKKPRALAVTLGGLVLVAAAAPRARGPIARY